MMRETTKFSVTVRPSDSASARVMCERGAPVSTMKAASWLTGWPSRLPCRVSVTEGSSLLNWIGTATSCPRSATGGALRGQSVNAANAGRVTSGTSSPGLSIGTMVRW